MQRYSFEDLLGDADFFAEEYFDKRPLLKRGAVPGDPQEILSLTDLDDLVNLEAVRPPYIGITKDGKPVDAKWFTRATVVQGTLIPDAVVPEKVHELFKSGASVTWMSLNQIFPQVRDFCRVFSRTFASRSDAVAFVTPPHSRGYEAHRDAVDVFVVQLAGQKHWQVWNDRYEGTGLCDTEKLGPPDFDVTLTAGDIFYLPYRTPHLVCTESDVSLHLSITVRPRLWRDLLMLTLHKLLDDPSFDDYPYLPSNDRRRVELQLQEKFESLQKLIGDMEAESEVDRLIRIGRSMEGSSSSRIFGGAERRSVHAQNP
ncbi:MULTISPECIES: JmjC domain-containing protein [Streptomyces violaceusniger group]|uniref:JmjC domain-containing protein n=2 Tax=Streptomyces rhizosphaericus TaxID=114699 RepID=A0ABN1S7W3_9ACTN|nr:MULTISPECIES: cupin domain-containing protein [Streptomyces violaceusniger group]